MYSVISVISVIRIIIIIIINISVCIVISRTTISIMNLPALGRRRPARQGLEELGAAAELVEQAPTNRKGVQADTYIYIYIYMCLLIPITIYVGPLQAMQAT